MSIFENFKKNSLGGNYKLPPKFCYTLFLLFFFSFLLNAQPDRADRPVDFPTPPLTDNSLFFIQRNLNKNTIVYDAKLDEEGNYHSSKPIDAYWRRYASTGERKELKWVDKTFAYGYSSKKRNGKILVELVAYDERYISLEKTPEGKPVATIMCNGKKCKLDYIYVFADESGMWPSVIHVDIHATDLLTGKKEKERILND
ncbi:MAG: DUF4833 domain-containing protein [Bacteroidota bacterium]